jgi:hypothetical protein
VFGQRTGLTGSYETAVQEDNYARFTKHGHLGLALTSGRYFYAGADAPPVHFVSGAPGAGEVYFFSRDGLTGRLEMEDRRTIAGSGFGGGFGTSLETLDANRDGRDDLGKRTQELELVRWDVSAGRVENIDRKTLKTPNPKKLSFLKN